MEGAGFREVRTYANLAFGHPAGFEFACAGFRPGGGQHIRDRIAVCCVSFDRPSRPIRS